LGAAMFKISLRPWDFYEYLEGEEEMIFLVFFLTTRLTGG